MRWAHDHPEEYREIAALPLHMQNEALRDAIGYDPDRIRDEYEENLSGEPASPSSSRDGSASNDKLVERLLAKRAIDETTGCWNWTGYLNTARGGYGYITLHPKVTWRIHRLAHELFIGPIPPGFEVDHLCFNRACFNPDHLEAVTKAENTRRFKARQLEATHCRHGHPWTPENTYTGKDGWRACRTCVLESQQRKRAAQTSTGLPPSESLLPGRRESDGVASNAPHSRHVTAGRSRCEVCGAGPDDECAPWCETNR